MSRIVSPRAPTLDRRIPLTLDWFVGAALAVALHVGAVLFLLDKGSGVTSHETLGAMAIEIALENAAPTADSSESEDVSGSMKTASSPAASEPVRAAEPTDPAPPGPAADVDTPAARPDLAERNDHDEETVKQAAAPVAPQVAEAPSRVADREDVRSVAAVIGSSAAAQRAQAAWRRGLVAHIERQKRHPAGAARSADILVSFRIDHTGRLLGVELAKGSGDARYDQAALDMVRRADPMPPPPPDLPDQKLSFRIPISFRVGG